MNSCTSSTLFVGSSHTKNSTFEVDAHASHPISLNPLPSLLFFSKSLYWGLNSSIVLAHPTSGGYKYSITTTTILGYVDTSLNIIVCDYIRVSSKARSTTDIWDDHCMNKWMTKQVKISHECLCICRRISSRQVYTILNVKKQHFIHYCTSLKIYIVNQNDHIKLLCKN